MPSIAQLVRADQDPIILVKAPALPRRTSSTPHVAFVYAGAAIHRAEKVNFAFKEADDRRVLEEPDFVLFAAGTVGGFIEVVASGEVVFSLRR